MRAEVATGDRVAEKAATKPSTRATILGEVVGSLTLSSRGNRIGAAAFVPGNQGGVSGPDNGAWFSRLVGSNVPAGSR